MEPLKSDLEVLNWALTTKTVYWYDITAEKVSAGIVVAVEYADNKGIYTLLIQEHNTGKEYSIPLRVCEFESL